MFQTVVLEKIKTQNFMFNCFSPENRAVYNVEKYCGTGGTTDDNMAHAHRMPGN
jgi:hypothetical protein